MGKSKKKHKPKQSNLVNKIYQMICDGSSMEDIQKECAKLKLGEIDTLTKIAAKNRQTLLSVAMDCMDLPLMKFLLESGANPNQPMTIDIHQFQERIIKKIGNDAKVPESGVTPLYYLLMVIPDGDEAVQMYDMLKKYGAAPTDSDKVQLAEIAKSRGKVHLFNKILSETNINELTDEDRCKLIINSASKTCMQLLINEYQRIGRSFAADIESLNQDVYNPLVLLCYHQYDHEVVKLILRQGVDLSKVAIEGTPLENFIQDASNKAKFLKLTKALSRTKSVTPAAGAGAGAWDGESDASSDDESSDDESSDDESSDDESSDDESSDDESSDDESSDDESSGESTEDDASEYRKVLTAQCKCSNERCQLTQQKLKPNFQQLPSGNVTAFTHLLNDIYGAWAPASADKVAQEVIKDCQSTFPLAALNFLNVGQKHLERLYKNFEPNRTENYDIFSLFLEIKKSIGRLDKPDELWKILLTAVRAEYPDSAALNDYQLIEKVEGLFAKTGCTHLFNKFIKDATGAKQLKAYLHSKFALRTHLKAKPKEEEKTEEPTEPSADTEAKAREEIARQTQKIRRQKALEKQQKAQEWQKKQNKPRRRKAKSSKPKPTFHQPKPVKAAAAASKRSTNIPITDADKLLLAHAPLGKRVDAEHKKKTDTLVATNKEKTRKREKQAKHNLVSLHEHNIKEIADNYRIEWSNHTRDFDFLGEHAATVRGARAHYVLNNLCESIKDQLATTRKTNPHDAQLFHRANALRNILAHSQKIDFDLSTDIAEFIKSIDEINDDEARKVFLGADESRSLEHANQLVGAIYAIKAYIQKHLKDTNAYSIQTAFPQHIEAIQGLTIELKHVFSGLSRDQKRKFSRGIRELVALRNDTAHGGDTEHVEGVGPVHKERESTKEMITILLKMQSETPQKIQSMVARLPATAVKAPAFVPSSRRETTPPEDTATLFWKGEDEAAAAAEPCARPESPTGGRYHADSDPDCI